MTTRTIGLVLVVALGGCDRLLMLGDDSRSGLLPCGDAATCAPLDAGAVCGFERDERGCERCACAMVDAGPACQPTICGLACSAGFERDDAGCERCACAMPDAGVTDAGIPVDAGSPRDAGAIDAGCEVDVDCLLACPHGFARDIRGCSVCTCAAPPSDAGCGGSFCQMPCQFGYKRTASGCGLCECSPAPAATCTPPPCSLTCIAGFNQDSSGCPVCECSP
ncbi:MAG: hypothetical protein ABTQ32_13385 [Myxococcaceae bacterium]